MNVKIVKCKHCMCIRWGIASVGISLLGVAHPIWDNISGAGQAPIGNSHTRPRE